MKDGIIYTAKTTPYYNGNQITLGDIMETGDISKEFLYQMKDYSMVLQT